MVVTVQAIVMLFGALTAVVGVLLLFLRQEGGRNTIRIIGQEFEISTPALARVTTIHRSDGGTRAARRGAGSSAELYGSSNVAISRTETLADGPEA
jgi:hypothetical protein